MARARQVGLVGLVVATLCGSAALAGEPAGQAGAQPASGAEAGAAPAGTPKEPTAPGAGVPTTSNKKIDQPKTRPKPKPRPTEPPPGSTKAERLAWEAGRLVDQGKLDQAEVKASEALSEDNDSAAARFQRARIKLRRGSLIGAYQELKEAIEKDPKHAPSQILLVHVSKRGGQSVDAQMRQLDKLVLDNPDDLGLKLALAEAQLAVGKVPAALKTSRTILKKAETSVQALKLMARAYMSTGRTAAAEGILTHISQTTPDAEASALMAKLLLDRGEMIEARKWLEEAVEFDPLYVEALASLGMIYVRVRSYDLAEDVLTRAIALAPAFAVGWLNLGAAQRGAKRFEAAEKSWKKALELDPKLAAAHYNLGIMYRENPMPGRERIAQLEAAIDQFNAYKRERPASDRDDTVDKYIAEAQLLIKQEKERRKEELKRLEEQKKNPPEGGGDGSEGGDGSGGGEGGAEGGDAGDGGEM